ncbi:MAG: ABC transporter ATP-binding protein [Phycisphaerae bacterium]
MIRVSGLSFRAGTFSAEGMDLEVPSGQYFVILGPTGSGKTLLLKCLCGIIRAAAGSISVDGRDVTSAEPRSRMIGYVPQDAGLFPHLSVARNITFGLRVRGQGHDDALRLAAPIIDALGLGPLLDRGTTGLSGGERQKVAVARALAASPKLLLLDEPASALDGPSRQGLCRELRHVQRQFGIVTIHVCHNLEEAMAVGDRAGVIVAGRLVQTGTMSELIARPANETVARLLGGQNIFTGTAVRGAADEQSIVSFAGLSLAVAGRHEGAVKCAIRPESIRLRFDGCVCPDASAGPGMAVGQGQAAPTGAPAQVSRIRAVLRRIENRGPYCHLEFTPAAPPENRDAPYSPGTEAEKWGASLFIVVHVSPQEIAGRLAEGQEAVLEVAADAVHVFPGQS